MRQVSSRIRAEASAGNAAGSQRPLRYAAVCISGIFVLASSAAPLYAASAAANVDFSARLEHQGLVIDQARNGEPAALVPAGSLFSSGPNYVLQAGGKTLAGLWLSDPGHVTVRRSADPVSPLIGTVTATWDHGAIRLTLQPADGPTTHVGRFHRTEGASHPELLSPVTTVVDLRGMYMAAVRDAQGNDAGWLRVRISPYQEARRIYDASLPASVSEPLAAAAVFLVNSDVSYLRSRAVDVYMGN